MLLERRQQQLLRRPGLPLGQQDLGLQAQRVFMATEVFQFCLGLYQASALDQALNFCYCFSHYCSKDGDWAILPGPSSGKVPTRDTMLPAFSPSAAWQQDTTWHVAAQPVASLYISNARSLATLGAQHQQMLARLGPVWSCGLLSYHAGELLHGLVSRATPDSPLAVIHYYPDELVYRVTPPGLPLASTSDFALVEPLVSQSGTRQYHDAVERIKAYLLAGDVYQVNYARRFAGRFHGDALALWLQLLAQHVAPHASYFRIDAQRAVMGVSPERFLRIRDNQVVTEPIKGSRPRGTSQDDDQRLANDLLASPKDRAENLMIVDLLRNDLGQVCVPGSIVAEPLFELRRFSNVQHLVSTVRGELRHGINALDALLACFPGGSITGAPKKRAMEIIAELEPHPRGFYCGTQFSIDPDGNLDSNILIRTFQSDGERIYCHGGGGIVMDSDAEQEFAESEFKIRALMNALS
jgi:para-aminobenzoate synthetase component 1